jgi:outer membrane protein TolC
MTAQDFATVWREVEANNLTLKAARQLVEADQMENRVGLAPDNPEVEFAYLWGSGAAQGDRIDVSVTQSFDFPTSYVYRGRIANLRNEQVDLAYQQERQALILEVGELYYNILYQNVRIEDMEHCLKFLSDVSEAYRRKLEAGSINIFEYNKVRLAELNLAQEKSHAEAEREGMLLEMKRLNGGVALDIMDSEFPEMSAPADFDVWYNQATQRLPSLLLINKQLEENQQQIKLEKSQWAPRFLAGYMREQVPSEIFQGIKVGVSVPLWQNVNSVKQTKLRSSALQLQAADVQSQTYNDLKTHYLMLLSVDKQIADYHQLLETVDAMQLLKEALDSGQMSLVDYLFESSIYHESHERFAELQYDAAKHYLVLQVYSGL